VAEEQQEKHYTTREVCEKVSVSKNTLFKWLDRGFIKAPAKRTVYQFLWNEDNLANIMSYVERRKR
jgi:excisionase family DNA binding protein